MLQIARKEQAVFFFVGIIGALLTKSVVERKRNLQRGRRRHDGRTVVGGHVQNQISAVDDNAFALEKLANVGQTATQVSPARRKDIRGTASRGAVALRELRSQIGLGLRIVAFHLGKPYGRKQKLAVKHRVVHLSVINQNTRCLVVYGSRAEAKRHRRRSLTRKSRHAAQTKAFEVLRKVVGRFVGRRRLAQEPSAEAFVQTYPQRGNMGGA